MFWPQIPSCLHGATLMYRFLHPSTACGAVYCPEQVSLPSFIVLALECSKAIHDSTWPVRILFRGKAARVLKWLNMVSSAPDSRWLFCSCRVCLGPASHEMQFWGLVGEKQTGHIFKSQDRNHLAEDLRVVVSAVWKCMRFWTWGSPIKLAATVPAVFIVFVVLQFPWSILMENPIYTITTIMTILTTENIATITFCYDQTRSVIPD